ncbi:MAG TPA: hypothetical protein VD913_00315 [bacterium]|nr:hypothetical protein [bacterium]
MLLGNKKNQENDHNWCLVLNTLHNEIDKKKVAGKISEVFSLSQEEAIDLVSNTPIILLDNLNRPTAVQAKDYFRPTGAEIFLTNDIFLKRKCYRTVWPEPPNLTFLQRLEEFPKRDEPQERLAPQEAVHALRSQDLKETKENRPLEETEKKVSLPVPDKGAARDINRLKEEVGTWRRKFEAQSQELEKLRKEFASRERVVSSSDSVVREREKEIQKQKALLANAEEKYEGLKEEYRHARTLFEEKFGILNKEAQEGKKKGEQLVKENEKLEQLRKSLEQELNQRTQRFEGVDEEFRQIRTLLETKLKEAGQEMDAWKSKSEEMNKKIQALDHEREQLGQKINQQIKENESWRQKYQEAADQLVALQSGRDHEKIYFEKEKEKLDQLHKHKESVEKSLAEESEKAGRLEQQLASTLQEIEEWKTRADEMAGKLWNFEQSEKDLNKILREKEDSLRIKIEARQKEHEAVLSEKVEENNALRAQCEELTTRLHALEMVHKQEKAVRAKTEERLKELEQGKLVFEQTLNQVQRSYEVLQEQYRKEQIRAEDQASQAAKDVEDWKVRLAEMSGQVDRLAQEKTALEQKINEQANEIHAGHETHINLTEKIQAVQISYDQEVVLKEKAVAELQGVRKTFQTLEKLLRDEQLKSANLEKEKHEIRLSLQQKLEEAQHEAQSLKTREEEFKGKIQAFEKNQLQLIQELEERTKKLRQGEVKILEMEKALQELTDSSQNLEKMFQANLKQLEGKERDLELSRKQIRELNLQLEQRELIFKRTQLTNQLIEKENQLKGLVEEQERIEFEIRDREETLRKVLSEQENVEKEIIEGKQAQRHYLEQAKKEKSRFKGGRSDEDISETEFPSQEAHSVEND